MSEESAAASKVLSEEAQNLAEVVSVFQLDTSSFNSSAPVPSQTASASAAPATAQYDEWDMDDVDDVANF
ncbi:MAG: hypothetical protein AB8G17_01735 [Gammaproteobacteria bacterium]